MALTTAQVADLKDKWQYFTCEFVVFPQITWSLTDFAAYSGAITWKPFCLLSPRYAYTTGASVTIYGGDSYIRPTTAADTVTFTKASGTGTVTDNADKTCTVSSGSGMVVVEATATASGQTAVAYAYVYFGSAGNLDAIAGEVHGLSGSLATGEWQADLVCKGDISAVLTDDGRDQPVLMHVTHYYDGSANTFGGYKRHNNTFVLLCRDSSIRVNHSGEYETVLHLESPAYVLKRCHFTDELTFSTAGNGGLLTTTNLTPTDPTYFVLREGINLHQYFNISLWNNSSTISRYNVKPRGSFWDLCLDGVGFNFGMMYFNRWSNLLAQPDPRARYSEWTAIADEIFDSGDPLTSAHMLEYEVYHRREDNVGRVGMQAALPDMTIINSNLAAGSFGESVEVNSLLVKDSDELDGWVDQYKAWMNTEYEITMRLPMGHELNPGDVFYLSSFSPPGGADAVGDFSMAVDDISYEFDFERGFWTRRIHATKLNQAGA